MLVAVLLFFSAVVMSASAHEPQYFNEWAVEVKGGEETAKRVARELGYTYAGPMQHLDDHYFYLRDDHPEMSTRSADHHTEALLDRDEVVWAMQQKTLPKMSLRGLPQ